MDAKAAAAEAFVREPAAGSTLNVLGITHIYNRRRDRRVLLALGVRGSAGCGSATAQPCP